MKQSSELLHNQKLLIQSFKHQNDQAYDEALEKLQLVGDNLFKMIQKIDYNSQFYMKYMPLMKQQRQIVDEKDYKQFINKNEKILSRNFQKNAYLALLMQQIQDQSQKQDKKKWTLKQQQHLVKLMSQKASIKQLYHKFNRHPKVQIDKKYQLFMSKKQTNELKIIDEQLLQ